VSFADETVPIEGQLMLDYANGMSFKEVLSKYRLYLARDLRSKTLLQDDCECAYLLEVL
jgi:hypothetical protein